MTPFFDYERDPVLRALTEHICRIRVACFNAATHGGIDTDIDAHKRYIKMFNETADPYYRMMTMYVATRPGSTYIMSDEELEQVKNAEGTFACIADDFSKRIEDELSSRTQEPTESGEVPSGKSRTLYRRLKEGVGRWILSLLDRYRRK